QISDLLGQIESIVVSSTSKSTVTDAEISANQSQIDNALTAIDRIVNTTNFNGKRLLDGSLAIDTTGVNGNSYVTNFRAYARTQETTDTSITLNRVASATVASATFAFAGDRHRDQRSEGPDRSLRDSEFHKHQA
ncbi:MAG: hypothetical protein HYR83_03580, partial [Planctomycetes bacterium]|nr:hypothetical protein [Planctomycetota bacterium]